MLPSLILKIILHNHFTLIINSFQQSLVQILFNSINFHNFFIIFISQVLSLIFILSNLNFLHQIIQKLPIFLLNYY